MLEYGARMVQPSRRVQETGSAVETKSLDLPSSSLKAGVSNYAIGTLVANTLQDPNLHADTDIGTDDE